MIRGEQKAKQKNPTWSHQVGLLSELLAFKWAGAFWPRPCLIVFQPSRRIEAPGGVLSLRAEGEALSRV
jgi:hypothetical protein